MKKHILSGILGLMLCCFFGSAQAQFVPNDDCFAAFPISSGQTVSGTTVGATTDNLSTCGTSISAPGVWYFIVGNGGQLTASTCNQASYDTKISIFSGNCAALTCEGGNDDGAGCSGFTSEATVTTTPGTLYYILVHGFLSSTGNFDLTATLSSPPAGNDVCGGALPISCGQTVSGTTVGATPDGAPFCGTSNTAPGVWYQFVGNGDFVNASLCNGTSYDSKLTVYSGSCGALTCVAGNDDACGLQSEVQFQSNAGQSYYILVHGFGSSSGAFDLSLGCIAPAMNDAPCNADPLSFGVTTYNHIGLTADANEISPGAGTGTSSCNSQDGWCSFETDVDNSAWFTFVAPASGSIGIAANASGWDSQIAVYEASDCNDYGTFVELGANDDSADDVISGSSLFAAGIGSLNCLTPGATYYVQVDGYNGDEAIGAEITLVDNGGTLPVVEAGDCQSRYLGYAPVEGDTNFLQACVTGGEAPYTFTWSGGSSFFQVDDATCSNLAVQPGATTTYTVTVTDARGCTTTDEVTVNVIDVSCGNNPNNPKVLVCKVPPGNPANAHTICVSPNAVPAHLATGSFIGPCNNPCRATNPSVAPPPACVDLTVSVTTDRFANETSWEIVDRVSGQSIASTSYTFNDDEMTFTETFCVDPTRCYDITMFDSFGDGMCCTFGNGTWSVTFDGVITASPTGGSFGSSETISVGNCSNKSSSAQTALSSDLNVVAFPNPANNMANIKFIAPQKGNVTVELYSITGAKVATVFNGEVEAGIATVAEVNVSEVPAGVYIYRVTTDNEVKSGKIQIAH